MGSTPRRHDWPWIAILIAINLVVLVNAILHDPGVGYDAADHIKYFDTLAEARLPRLADSMEFFSPPLTYVAPALLHASGLLSEWGAAKGAQLLNVLFSIALTLCLAAICDRIRPGDAGLKTAALFCLGMLPVYYKSFAFVRGEPLLALIALLVADRAARLLLDRRPALRGAVVVGILLGLAALTRQWGFFLFPAVAIFAILAVLRRRLALPRVVLGLAVSVLIAALVGGWFYLFLRQTSGSMRAFNRPASPRFSFSNVPDEFYTELALDRLFVDPVRPGFGHRFLPIFYSEMWGDYWMTFLVNGRDTRDGSWLSGGALYNALRQDPPPSWLESNYRGIAPSLGRVNLVSLLPTTVLLAGLLFGATRPVRWLRGKARAGNAGAGPEQALAIGTLLFLIVAASAAGYAWFLLMYPRPDTIKAAYMLQVFPALAILSGDLLVRLRARSIAGYRTLMALMGLAALHNAPALLTRYATAW